MELANDSNRAVTASVLFLLCLAVFLIGFIFYILGANQKVFGSSYVLYMRLANAQSLNSGAFVNLAGVKVGTIGNVQITNVDSPSVRVKLNIEKKYRSLITKSSIAKLKTQGVLGNRYVDISFGKPDEAPLKDGDFIKSESPSDINEVVQQIAASVNHFQSTLENVDQITEATLKGPGVLSLLIRDEAAQNDLRQLLANLDKISIDIAQGRGSLGQFVQDTVFYNGLVSTVKKIDKITTKIQMGQGDLGKIIADTTLFANLRTISSESQSLLHDLQHHGTIAQLLEDKRLYDQLLKLTTSLSELVDEIKRNPQKLKIELF